MSPITTNNELARLCEAWRAAPFVAVDTEFMRETTYWPKLCLVQAAGPGAEALIDPLADGLDLSPFLDLLRDERVVKVFHAARQDVEIFNNLGAIPRPLFDTQIAAMAAGFGEQVAYDALARKLLKVEIDKSHRFTDWARRPLSTAQLAYALADVTHLAAVYPMLRGDLEAKGRLAWVAEEMAALTDPGLYDVTPENAWKRLKPKRHGAKYLAIFRAVAAWRERTAQTRDQPRGRILKDEAIDDVAGHAPASPAALEALRSLPRGFSGSRFAGELLAVVAEAAAAAASEPAQGPRPPAPARPPAAAAVVELLKVLLKARADDAGVATRLLATVGDLERIAQDSEADVPALHGWRRAAFGEDALRLKRGEIALVLDGDKVAVAPVRRRSP